MTGFVETVLLGAIAGFTIFLGLPVALLDVAESRIGILNGGAIGILVFLLIEILGGVIEPVEETIEHIVESGAVLGVLDIWVAAVGGVTVGLVGLAWFEERYVAGQAGDRSNATLALMIALGIGLHNFSEGLAIGQAAASGAMSLATLLVVGFALHNITEGFGIAAPLTDEHATVSLLVGTGLLAGGPTFLGTIIGQVWVSEVASVLFLALAGGALLYVIEQLFAVSRQQVGKSVLFMSVAGGFFVGFGTELLIELATLV